MAPALFILNFKYKLLSERKSRPRLSLPLRCFLLLNSPHPFPIYDPIVPRMPFLDPGTRSMRQPEPKREAAIVLFRLPTRGFPAVKLNFGSSPVPCVHLPPLPLTRLKSILCILYRHTLQSVNPHLLFITVLESFGPILHCSICNVSYYYSPLVSSFPRPLCFPFSPRTMTLASSAFHWPNHGDSLVFIHSAFRFHTQIHYCLPCFSCQASCGRCDQG
jgi:hypothetical protein